MYCVYKHKRIIIIIEMVWNSKTRFWRAKLEEVASIISTYSKKYQTLITQPPCCAGYTDSTARELEGFVPFTFTTENCTTQASSLMDITQPASSACHTLALPIRTIAGIMYSTWPDDKQI
ncbi:hypothetical protein HBI56_118350 [Parastagonospora nodorum]|uniref:Uncharacterized protein n=1 Tax=Phaeosphaeria nodorum (strain SN15 / ATCC MYA-4574 / FGSC 10173) TaxID=321614 RepID=A0A7U2FBY8_PHANO|nr:hypothetical protein HBH56_056420 [Parastagonospora nodorum]QRD02474.1 hypothetical protein JI435_418030 [Parastagonospora nodorum SN15]KAH3921103.1 hypothetical protein HBH54_245830 [Parastagonospora nodorum]KAH3956441.1 hypothetical protein HBH51_242230 [Parastagonospora nodorum]KAH3988700.1 hypothetical protein HBH52_030830 [Parastagonospora nodorum]